MIKLKDLYVEDLHILLVSSVSLVLDFRSRANIMWWTNLLEAGKMNQLAGNALFQMFHHRTKIYCKFTGK